MTVDMGSFSGVSLKGMTVAIMVASGFTQTEFSELQRALVQTGATLKTISCDNGLVNGWDGNGFGHTFPVDTHLGEILAADLDALVVPGGSRSITKLKTNLNTARIVRNMIDAGKPVVLMGDAAELLTHAARDASSDVMQMTVTAETDAAETGTSWAQRAVQHIADVLMAAEQDMQAAA